MDSVELEELGQRALACKHWRWMVGMRPLESCAVVFNVEDENVSVTDGCSIYGLHRYHLPDLSDPATLGCLLRLVRKAWLDIGINAHCDYLHGQYVWRITDGHPHGSGFRVVSNKKYEAEAEALVAALEAANV